ncbi:hypothetical protein TWF694_009711 [Orbilia ellipsospora]|uniref:Uncharacterized protein n=1 Tax=Orbilia ellipsospora TaxID=2528407 RepID=A0AAV9XEC5_9PEZI
MFTPHVVSGLTAVGGRPRVIIRPGYKASPDKNFINESIINDGACNDWAPWRGGDMTPNTRWYHWLIPTTYFRSRGRDKDLDYFQILSKEEEEAERTKAYDDARTKAAVKEAIERAIREAEEAARLEEERKRARLRQLYGDVDSGHCADSPGWMERGDCMCTVTWRMPGRFPHSFCENIHLLTRGYDGLLSPKCSPDNRPCWVVQPDPEDPSTRLCWRRKYNDLAKRYEYVADTWQPQVEGQESEYHDHSDEVTAESYSGSFSEYLEPPGTPQYPDLMQQEEETFTCSRKPPWLQHVQRFFRAEELASPAVPASQFITKTGTILGTFSSNFFAVPYYDVIQRRFKYTEGTLDWCNLKMKFKYKAPPPTPVAPKYKPPVKKPLVMPTIKSPVAPIVHTDYKPDYYRPFYRPPEPVRFPVAPEPIIEKAPPVNRQLFQTPRFTVFPRSPEIPEIVDTPCPAPKKWAGRKVTRTRRVRKDDDGEYLPSSESDSEEEVLEFKATPATPVPKKKKKKKKKRRRLRRNSDPTYRQHGVRENNRIEKGDLAMMHQEEAWDDSEDEDEEPPKAPKAIRKPAGKGKQNMNFPPVNNKRGITVAKSVGHKVEMGNSDPKPIVPPTPQKRVMFVQPKIAAPHPINVQRRRGSDDGAYKPFQDPEEARIERQDVRDMEKQVDRGSKEQPKATNYEEKKEEKLKKPVAIATKPTKLEPKIERPKPVPKFMQPLSKLLPKPLAESKLEPKLDLKPQLDFKPEPESKSELDLEPELKAKPGPETDELAAKKRPTSTRRRRVADEDRAFQPGRRFVF